MIPHVQDTSFIGFRQRSQLVSRELLALAFATNRADHYERVIDPFIRKSSQHICISDRYYLSSLVYQSKSSVDSEFQSIMDLNFAAGKPDLIIFLNASAETCYLRMKKRQEDKDLFERNLNQSKKKYEEAIRYLSEHHDERIVEVDADKEIIDVIRDIGKILTGENGPGWIAFQDPISVDTLPQTVSLTNNFNLTIDEYSRKFKSSWYGNLLSKEELFHVQVEELRESILADINRLSYRDVVSLFISFLKLLGYQIGEKLPWSDIDAFHANYVLPGDMSFDGAAIIFSAIQKQITLTKKMIEVGQSLDFLLLFDLRITRYIEYYGRDPLIEGEKQKPPPTFVVNRNHITDLVLATSLLKCVKQYRKFSVAQVQCTK
jgi:thymidylate kinase